MGYDEEVEPAMEWVFGSTFICEDAETAKRVTFDRDVRMKSVTHDGDVYDPFGTLSGGSKPQSAGVLIKLQELAEIRAEIKQHKKQLEALEEEIQASQKSIAQYRQCKQRLDLQAYEVSLLEDRLSKSTHAQVSRILPSRSVPLTDECILKLKQRVEAIKQQIAEQEQVVIQAQNDRQKALADSERIEREMQEFNNNKDTKLEEMTVRLSYIILVETY